jgi:hypothetical protein
MSGPARTKQEKAEAFLLGPMPSRFLGIEAGGKANRFSYEMQNRHQRIFGQRRVRFQTGMRQMRSGTGVEEEESVGTYAISNRQPTQSGPKQKPNGTLLACLSWTEDGARSATKNHETS